MVNNIPKISVLVICYKQEELIKRALNSLLAQREYIYEICVSDDCSPDRTWAVLEEYDKQYPGLFKLHQNRPNVGIFENIEYTWTMPTGDVIYQLSGDDEVGDGWFRTVTDFIMLNNIDYKNELFCIYGDYKCVYPNGDSLSFKNKKVKTGNNALQLALRQIICNRSACYSIKVLNMFINFSKGRSHVAENIQDRQLQLFAQKNYYIPMIGNIYYSAIGISTRINETLREEREMIWPYTVSCLETMGVQISRSDRYYIKSQINRVKYLYHGGLIRLFGWLINSLLAFNIQATNIWPHLKHIAFAVLRRMPHSYCINI